MIRSMEHNSNGDVFDPERPENAEILGFEKGLIREIIDKVGARIPGSEEEHKAALIIAEKLKNITRSDVKVEPFKYAPKASIGLIPALGWFLILVIFPLFYINPVVCFIIVIITLFFAFIQIFRYLGWFDFIFPKKVSHNVYSIIENANRGKKDNSETATDEKGESELKSKPESESAESKPINIFLVAHIDSSWHSPLLSKKPGRAFIKIGIGLLSIVFFITLTMLEILYNASIISGNDLWLKIAAPICLPGFFFIARYLVWKKEIASPGAMDDLAGIAIIHWLGKYFKEHPDELPPNVNLVILAVGAEEAGLKGSFAFIKNHRSDILSPENESYVIIVDGIGDKDFVHIVAGDIWLGTRYDTRLVDLANSIMDDLNIHHDIIRTPAGATDGGAFSRANIPVVALAAQDPTPADNYHTFKDRPERIEPEALLYITYAAKELVKRIAERFGRN